jgi:hypothetical protein
MMYVRIYDMETKVKKIERMTVLGSRVYKKHRVMIRALSKQKKIKEGAIVRLAIEKFYDTEKILG